MHYAFEKLEPDYELSLAHCAINPNRQSELEAVCDWMLNTTKDSYQEISAETGIPVLWMMPIGEREAGHAILKSYFGNGQSLRRRTTIVPKGRGPFDSFKAGALDALHLDRIDRVQNWTWPMMCYEDELWNGFGPRMHGRHTGYLWAGTNIYSGGKYVQDGVWAPGVMDIQLGTVPMMLTLVKLDPSLDFGSRPVSVSPPAAQLIPAPHPAAEIHDIAWVQTALNKIQKAGLDIDGSLGRHTARAITLFQEAHGLDDDGVPGGLTKTAIAQELAGG